MRRRQIFAAKTAMAEAYNTALEEQDKEKNLEAGKCPKCGKKIARGMYMHQKWCGHNKKGE